MNRSNLLFNKEGKRSKLMEVNLVICDNIATRYIIRHNKCYSGFVK